MGQVRRLRSWCVSQNFLYPQRDQPLLLPVDVREWLPEDNLVFVVLDAVATLDLGGFHRRYRADGHGRAAFDPEMMVALLLYGYCQGERSSRVIEQRCVRDVGYRVIASWAPCRRLARCWAHRSTSIRTCSSTKRWSLPQGARPNPFSSRRRIYSSTSRLRPCR
jgi:hypothetical protein